MHARTHQTNAAARAHARAAAFALAATASAAWAQPGTLAATPARASFTAGLPDAGPADLSTPRWVFPQSDPAAPRAVAFVPQSAPVVAGDLVIALARRSSPTLPAALYAVSLETGRLAWTAPLPDLTTDGFPTPTADARNNAVLVAAGTPGPAGGTLFAFDLETGLTFWTAPLARDAVSATVLVTADRGPADRAFVTDADPFFFSGDGAALTCVNLDPRDPARNPFDPGEVVYRLPLMSGATGATPAYDGARIYLATSGDAFGSDARILAFDARATSAEAAPVWSFEAGGNDAFFGGVAVVNGAVYAATYDFFGGLDSARLFRLDAATGEPLWDGPAASNRTNAVPIALPDDRVVLSTGIVGFGSAPRLELFDDPGPGGGPPALLEASAIAGPGSLGGWTHQPHAVLRHPATAGPALFIGTLDPAPALFGGYTRLSLVDLAAPLGSSGSVVSSFDAAGSSPAVFQDGVYTIGAAGLVALGGPPWRLDVNGDGRGDDDDLHSWSGRFAAGERGAALDVDRDGAVTAIDGRKLEAELRRRELGGGVR